MITQTEAGPRPVPDRYRAPSFSWASTDEEITAGEPHKMGIILDVSSMFYIKVALLVVSYIYVWPWAALLQDE